MCNAGKCCGLSGLPVKGRYHPPMSDISQYELPGGATLLVEPIASVASAAVVWRIAAGSGRDPAALDGAATMLGELVLRGAGERDSRTLSDAFDRLGVRRETDVQLRQMELGAIMLGHVVPEALALLIDVIRRPSLNEASLEPVRSLCIQALDAIDDEPQSRVMLHLRERHMPAPLNRSGYGRREVLESIDIETLRDAWRARATPGGSVVAVAGAVDPDHVAELLRHGLSDWQGAECPLDAAAPPPRGYLPVERDTAQVHIAMAWDAPREADRDSVLERLALTVLGGASSGRLFTEVRVRRGLCYSVGASYRGGRDEGLSLVYAGTTPQRAQETLDVTLAEIRRIRSGVTAQEFETARVRLKSRLVMAGESTGSRATRLASDHERLGRPRTLEELTADIDAVDLARLNGYLTGRTFGRMSLVTIGPAPLDAGMLDNMDAAQG